MSNSSYTRNRKRRRRSRRRRTRRNKRRRRRRQRGGGPGAKGTGAKGVAADAGALAEFRAHMANPDAHSGKGHGDGGLPKGDGTGPNTPASNKGAKPGPWSGATGGDEAGLKLSLIHI